jgi:hypothetical protein
MKNLSKDTVLLFTSEPTLRDKVLTLASDKGAELWNNHPEVREALQGGEVRLDELAGVFVKPIAEVTGEE